MHYIELYIFALDLCSNSLNHFIWKWLKVIVCGRLPLSRYANNWLDHDDVSIGLCCALLAPQWKANLRSTSVKVMNTGPLGYSVTGLESQNTKFALILIITGPKNDHFSVCKQTGFVDQRLWDFAKMTLTRVSRHDCDSSRVILWKTWVESSHHLSQRDSSRVRVIKNRDSSRVIDSSHAITANRQDCIEYLYTVVFCYHLLHVILNRFMLYRLVQWFLGGVSVIKFPGSPVLTCAATSTFDHSIY